MWYLHLQAREIIISMSVEYILNYPIYIH